MSTRSIRRNHRRELARAGRRRAAVAVGTAASASLLLASGADAATFTVNSTADNGDGTCDSSCTLRDAALNANADPDADIINFTALPADSTITLTDPQVPLTESVTITGPGQGDLTVNQTNTSGGENSRVFAAQGDIAEFPRPDVTITGLTISGGLSAGTFGAGGGVWARDVDIALTDIALTDNDAGRYGGGFFAYRSGVDVSDVLVSDNSAGQAAGGFYARESGYASNVSVSDATITDNTVTGSGFGVRGGGISLVYGEVTDSTITGNVVNGGDGGGVDLRAGADAIGNTITDNTATSGGGVAMSGSGAEVRNSTVSGNTSVEGGGGIYMAGGNNTIADSTISGNTSAENGGGVFADGPGAKMLRSTVVDNVAGSATYDGEGGGLYFDAYSYNGPTYEFKVTSSIVANNEDFAGESTDVAVGYSGVFNASFSLIEVAESDSITSEAVASNIFGTDPQLGPLADNGGPTFTHLPDLASPVIDAGQSGNANSDQRGEDRPVDSAATNGPLSDGAEMGSVEVQDETAPGDDPPPVPVPDTSITSGPSGSGNASSVTFAFTSPDNLADFECSLDGAAFAECTSPVTLTGLADGAHVFQVRAFRGTATDPTPATRTFVVGTPTGGGGGPTPDTRTPETAITTVPTKLQAKGKKPAKAKLAFIGIDDVTYAGALTFECKLDAAAYAPCSSPSSLKVKKGTHMFSVRAKDAAGNVDATPASTTFKVTVKKKPKK